VHKKTIEANDAVLKVLGRHDPKEMVREDLKANLPKGFHLALALIRLEVAGLVKCRIVKYQEGWDVFCSLTELGRIRLRKIG